MTHKCYIRIAHIASNVSKIVALQWLRATRFNDSNETFTESSEPTNCWLTETFNKVKVKFISHSKALETKKVRGQSQTHGKKLLPEAKTGLLGTGWPHKHDLACKQVIFCRYFNNYCILSEFVSIRHWRPTDWEGLVGRPTRHLCHPGTLWAFLLWQ